MSSPAIALESVSFSYDDTTALEDVRVTIPANSITAILGPNGAGKTTFVRLLTGILTPDAGSISVLGETPRSVARERIGLLPQSYRPLERLSPRELLTRYRGLYEQGRPVSALIDELGLAEAATRQYRHLSGGQQRRTCLAAALINDPDLLILDEPTTGIDPAGKQAIWSYLPTLLDADTTILVTTHDMQEADRLADRVAFFNEGELLAFGEVDSLIADQLGHKRLHIETPDPGPIAERFPDAHIVDEAVTFDSQTLSDVAAVLTELTDADFEVRSMRWEHPPLEEFFMTVLEEDEDR